MTIKRLTRTTVPASLCALIGASPAFAGNGGTPSIVPEPTALFVWAGIATAGAAAYWWRNRRAD
jgi:hypothetical protein